MATTAVVRALEIDGGSEAQRMSLHRTASQCAAIGMDRIEEHAQWQSLARLPMRVTSAIPLSGFKLKDLLNLKAGQMLATTWSSMEDVPLKIGSVQLGWSEFEVVEQRMAVRLTRLA